jgi:hypothetical protein
LSSPTPVVGLAKGSLGSEIIARVVVNNAVSKAVSGSGVGSLPTQIPDPLVHSTTSEPECARPHRDNRCSRHTRR